MIAVQLIMGWVRVPSPHTVGAVSNRTGTYGNQRHESSSVVHPSTNELVFHRPFLHGDQQFKTLETA